MAGRARSGRSDAWRLFEVELSPEEGGLERYLRKIVDRCADWFDATTASLFLQCDTSEEFRLAAVGGSDPAVPAKATVRIGAGVAGWSLQTGEPLLINDEAGHPVLVGKPHSRLASSIVVPLLAGETGPIGVLNLSRRKGKAPFTEQDLVRVRSLARQVSLAVSNARLFAQVTSAAAEARQASEKFQAVVHSLGVAVVVVEPHGVVGDVNAQAEELLGVDVRGHRLDERARATSEPLAAALASALACASSGKVSRERVLDAQLDRAWSVVCTPLPSGGATLAIEEVTSHERANREMARMARLAEIGQMTAAIAHEIRNPLTGIRSAAQMALEAPEHAAEFAAIIEDEVLKLDRLCEEFLEFARPLALRVSSVRMDELARQVADRMAAECSQRDVGLRVEIEAQEPTITGDALRLEQVLRNLVRNALQACLPGGQVTVTVHSTGMSVEDTGCGIEPERVGRLFTPFFTTKANGTGLGLSNVKKIIDAHGGRISVASEVGRGTRFEVKLA